MSLQSAPSAPARPAHLLAAYGLLGLPLAMSALPLYLHIPNYYHQQLGVPLAALGWVLFGARLFDTLQDPWLGQWLGQLQGQRRAEIPLLLAALVLAGGFAALWLPPVLGVSGSALLPWLGLMLVASYCAHSLLNITYLAWGSRLGNQVLAAGAWREGFGLAGVILASLIPLWLLPDTGQAKADALLLYVLLFAALLGLALAALLFFARHPSSPTSSSSAPEQKLALREVWANQGFRQLVPVYFCNALAAAVAATLVLFFINDRLQAGAYAGWFLAAYFCSGAAALPLWVKLGHKLGPRRAWMLSMLLSVCSFCACAWLQAGDIALYLVLCTLSGLSLGADLALPATLLAARIPAHHPPSAYFGVWTLLGKAALASASLCLPLLALTGWQAGQSGAEATQALAWSYALLPCALKLLACLLLRRIPE